MTYLEGHEASGLKIGDMVKITRKAKSNEDGWDNNWDKGMDKYIGKEFVISFDAHKHGFRLLNESYCYPYFILELVNPEEK